MHKSCVRTSMKKLFVWLSKSAKIVSKLAKMNTKVVCYICHLRKNAYICKHNTTNFNNQSIPWKIKTQK